MATHENLNLNETSNQQPSEISDHGTLNNSGESEKKEEEKKEDEDFNEIVAGATGVESQQQQPEAESDEVLENPCQPCLSEEKPVESKKYCNTCHEYLCEICIQFHKKFTVSKNHQLINKCDVILAGKQTVPTETCEKHTDKTPEFFCILHDAVCCSTCKVLEHMNCLYVQKLKGCAAQMKNSVEFKIVSSDFQTCLDSVNAALSEKKMDYDRVLVEKNASLEKLEELRNKYVGFIDKLKRKEERKINQKHKDVSQAIQGDIDTCEVIVSTLKQENEAKDEAGSGEINQFIRMKKVKTTIKKANAVIQAISTTNSKETVEYTEDDQILENLEGMNRLGILEQEIRVYSRMASKNILAGKDNSVIDTVLILNDGFVLVSDWIYKSVKVIDLEKNATVSSIKLDHCPFALCEIEANKFAVTLLHERCIQFLNLSDDKQLSKSAQKINTWEKCRGITCLNSRLFVCCGGYRTEDGGSGHIRIFNTDGTLEKIVLNDEVGTPTLTNPWTAIVCPAANCVYAIASKTTFVKLNAEGKLISKSYPMTAVHPRGIAVDDLGNVFIADYGRNTVKQFEANGKEVGTLLSEKDGIVKPTALSFNCKTWQLFVGLESSPHILLFQLMNDESAFYD